MKSGMALRKREFTPESGNVDTGLWFLTAARPAAGERDELPLALVLCNLHHLWIVLHPQSLHRGDHRQLQHAQEGGRSRSG